MEVIIKSNICRQSVIDLVRLISANYAVYEEQITDQDEGALCYIGRLDIDDEKFEYLRDDENLSQGFPSQIPDEEIPF